MAEVFDFDTLIIKDTWLACIKAPVHFLDWDGEREILLLYADENGKLPQSGWWRSYTWVEKGETTPFNLDSEIAQETWLVKLVHEVKFLSPLEVLLDRQMVAHGKKVQPRQDLAKFSWIKRGEENEFNFDTPIEENTDLILSITHKVHFCETPDHDTEIYNETVEDGETVEKPTGDDKWYEENTDFSEFDFSTPITHETWLIKLGDVYTVRFYQSDGITLIETQYIPNGNYAHSPRGYENENWCNVEDNIPFDLDTEITSEIGDIDLKICVPLTKYKVHFCENDNLVDINGISPVEVEDGEKVNKPNGQYNSWDWYKYGGDMSKFDFNTPIREETWLIHYNLVEVTWIDETYIEQ